MSASGGDPVKAPSISTAGITTQDKESPVGTKKNRAKHPRYSDIQRMENTSAAASPAAKRRAATTSTNDACMVIVDSQDDGTAIVTHNEITLDIRNMADSVFAPSPGVKIQLQAESPWVIPLLGPSVACAECKAVGARYEVLPDQVINQAWWLQYKLSILKQNGKEELIDIKKNQCIVRLQLERSNLSTQVNASHELQLDVLYQGFKAATSALGVDDTLSPRLKSFRHGADMMASLVRNPTGSRARDRFRGAEAAMALAKDTEDIDRQGFWQGAEAVASLLGCGNGEHDSFLLEDLCRVFDSTVAHVEDVCGGDAV